MPSSRRQSTPPSRLSRLVLALAPAAWLLLASPLAAAGVTVSGNYWLNPGPTPLLGPGDIDLPDQMLWLGGRAGNASFAALAGAQVKLRSLFVAAGQSSASATLDGPGTRLTLVASGHDSMLELGNYGHATLTISNGAVLDARSQHAACLIAGSYCGSVVSNSAGSSATLSISGAGSGASFAGALTVGNGGVDTRYDFGTPGGLSQGRVEVLAGATLLSGGATVGGVFQSVGGNGLERAQAEVQISGAGSRWILDGGPQQGDASLQIGANARAVGHVLASGGAQLQLLGQSGHSSVTIASRGGEGTLSLDASTADFAGAVVSVGHGGRGTLTLSSGATLAARQLNIASSIRSDPALGEGEVLLKGASTLLTLNNLDGHRLAVGDWGKGSLTVSDGALLDASGEAAACVGKWCGSIIGHMAGSTALFAVTGAGSEARLIGEMRIGAVQRFDLANNGFDGGTPDGSTRATVRVEAGGTLRSEWVNAGAWGPNPASRSEQSFADLVVDGAGSSWLIQGSALGGNDASLNLATGPRSTATLTVSQGGLLKLQAPAGRNASVDLSAGGQSAATVTGAGSRLEINGASSRLVVGNASGGSAALSIKDGAVLAQAGTGDSYLNIGEGSASGRVEILSGGQLGGARTVNVGSGGTASLLISGAGSLLTTDRNGSFAGQIHVGQQGSGRLDVLSGGAASAFSLQVGNGYDHGNRGQVVIDGAGSKLELDAVDWHRMAINSGSVIVSGGALLDGTVNPAPCAGHWCGVFLANNAGDNAVFTVTGAGSKARFLSNFNVGQGNVTAPPSTAWSLGEPGGTSTAQVNVLAGGRLETEAVNIAFGPSGPAATGSESVIAQLRIKGAGSVWAVSGNNTRAATFTSGVVNAANTLSDIQISDGGQLQLSGDPGWAAFVQLGSNGGSSRMSISGAGSKLVYGITNNAGLWIGRNGANASLNVSNGGRIEGVNRLQVGNSGAVGSFNLSGTDSSVSYGSSFADLFIGRGGVGLADISGGAQMLMHGNLFGRLTVGDNNGGPVSSGTGSLTLRGAGSLISLRSGVAGDANTNNPTVTVGWSANGTLSIRDGAALRVEGLAPASPAVYLQGAGLIAGQGSGAASNGRVEVSGAGARLDVIGTNPFITIGSGPYGSGQLSISNGAVVQTTLMGIADFGASGITQIDNATLKLDGAWRSGGVIGASLAVASGSGSAGQLSLNHGAQLIISNSGSERTNLSLGGLDFNPGGNGVLSVAGGSSVSIGGGGGGQFVVGMTAGGVGVASFSGGSTLNTSYVGVGALNGADTGIGTLIVNDSSSLNAATLEVGTKGFVGGTGALNANVINRGVFSPGNSPGTLSIHGSFENQAGGRLVLEVESDGHGGFITDHLLFDSGSSIKLGALKIEFHFLGATDPNAFQASGGFTSDNFLRQGEQGLDHGLLSGASYSASSSRYQFNSFSFSADGGAVFQAQAVPEPSSWLMLALGLGALAWLQRRRAGKA